MYELRRSSQEKEEIKRDQGLALKALEDDDSDLNDKEMAITTRKLKKFFKKARENFKKKGINKPKSRDYDQFNSFFKCEKYDHIVKNCPLLKEEQRSEQFRN